MPTPSLTREWLCTGDHAKLRSHRVSINIILNTSMEPLVTGYVGLLTPEKPAPIAFEHENTAMSVYELHSVSRIRTQQVVTQILTPLLLLLLARPALLSPSRFSAQHARAITTQSIAGSRFQSRYVQTRVRLVVAFRLDSIRRSRQYDLSGERVCSVGA